MASASNSPSDLRWDVIVVGGGPAGATCAARLSMLGRRVLLLERDRHPRFHLGESLLPNSLPVLEAIGVLDEVRARFLVKRGARFVDAADPMRSVRYAFADAFYARWDHAFEVPRDEFDEILFRRAKACGAETREGWEATRLHLSAGADSLPSVEHGPTHGVEVCGPDGRTHTLAARFIVDATGRDALVARAAHDVERLARLDRTALFTQVRGAWRDSGEREGDIQIVVQGDGEDRAWFWLIPFADGRTSVGAVVSNAWVRSRREQLGAQAGPEGLFEQAVRGSPTVTQMLAQTTRCFAPRAAADFSFRVRSIRGSGWLALGDACGFIDPLFSTGAHLALNGGLRAADAIDEALRGGDAFRHPALEEWEREMRAGSDLFLGAVQSFYAGADCAEPRGAADLASYLFASPQHPFLRRAITSLLAGDVFGGDSSWAREMRSRFPARS